jgi:hypothetical protein
MADDTHGGIVTKRNGFVNSLVRKYRFKVQGERFKVNAEKTFSAMHSAKKLIIASLTTTHDGFAKVAMTLISSFRENRNPVFLI